MRRYVTDTEIFVFIYINLDRLMCIFSYIHSLYIRQRMKWHNTDWFYYYLYVYWNISQCSQYSRMFEGKEEWTVGVDHSSQWTMLKEKGNGSSIKSRGRNTPNTRVWSIILHIIIFFWGMFRTAVVLRWWLTLRHTPITTTHQCTHYWYTTHETEKKNKRI